MPSRFFGPGFLCGAYFDGAGGVGAGTWRIDLISDIDALDMIEREERKTRYTVQCGGE